MNNSDQIAAALRRVSLAGRELGGGPSRILDLPQFATLRQTLSDNGIADAACGAVALGVVIGMTAAGAPEAEAALSEADRRWRGVLADSDEDFQ